MSPTTHIAAAANHGTMSVSSSRSFPAKSGRNTSGPSAAPNSAPKRTYEIARALRDSGYMSATAVRASSTAPFIPPTPRKPRTTSGAESTTHPSAVSRQPTIPTTNPPDEHGNAAVAIHEPTSGQSGERPRGQEDRRPETEDGLDPGHEDERDRGDCGCELQDAGERDEAEREKDGVPPDLPPSRHGASVSVATMAET